MRKLGSAFGAMAFTLTLATNASATESEPEATQLGKISVAGNEEIDVYLPRSTSTATGLDLSLRETPQSVTVITRARMDDQAIENISSALKNAVGITTNITSPLGSDGVSFFARGFEIKNFQIDGTPRPPAIYGFGETTTDMAIYERVEIVRGATGLMSGAGSPAATINLVRKRPTVETALFFEGEMGSWEHKRVVADVGGALNDSGSLRARAVLAYTEADGYVERSNTTQQVFYGITEADLTDRTLLTAGVEYQEFETDGASRGGVPLFFADGSLADLPRDSNTGAAWNFLSRETTRLFASVEHVFNNGWSVKLEGEESHPDYDEAFSYLYGPFDPQTGVGSDIGTARWASELKQRFFGVTASGAFQWLGQEQQLVFGATHSTAKSKGPDYPGWWSGADYWAALPNAPAFLDNGAFTPPALTQSGFHTGGEIEQQDVYAALHLKPTMRLATVLGLRVSDWKESDWDDFSGAHETTTLTDESSVLTPYAGVLFDITPNITAYASFTSIFEPQGAEDEAGDRLDPLVGNAFEIGLKSEFMDGRLYATIAAFRTEQDNFAVPIPGAPPNSNGNDPYSAEDGTVSKGHELEIVGELATGWQIGGGYAYAKAKDADDITLLTEIPKQTFKLFSTYQLRGPLPALRLGGNVRWQGKAYMDEIGPNGESFTQNSQLAVDLMAKYHVSQHLSLSLNVNNVFDENYYSGITWGHGVYETPRSFLLGARWDL
jgi:outer membrane receptor for ferric coprogen and ferric-rhodotorulic acid